MRKIDCKAIENCIYNLALKACVSLTEPCKKALKSAYANEDGQTCAFALKTLIENCDAAENLNIPVCQDTGMAVVIMEIGQEVYIKGGSLISAVNEGVRRAYTDGCFRQSICDPLTRVNTGDNTPAALHTEITDGDTVSITFMPKGFGSENTSKIFMLTPSQGTDGIIEVIVETVKLAGSRPCPPVYVGVGIGGSFDTCAYLAKKALARDIGIPSARADIAYIEKEALKRINALGIGCQGFQGKVTALGVTCEWAPTHIAGLPVAVNIQCHCVRCQKAVI